MKQLLWNSMKLAWFIVASLGYYLHYTDRLSAGYTVIWLMVCSVGLSAVYSFLMAYRTGTSTALGEFLSKSEIAEFNPNQWLLLAWVALSIGIALPAYHYDPPWAIVGPSLLAGAVVLTIAAMSIAGRCYHRYKKPGQGDVVWII